MTSITTQQTKLDLELVPKENRLVIGKCNGRIPHGLKPKEETFQVVLDALALTACYPAFIINADVPEVYMHQFWNSVYKHDTFYRFKIDKKKRFKLTLEIHQPWRTFDALINRSLSGKTSALDKLRLSRAQILWGMYHQNSEMKESKAYKTYLIYAIGTVPPKIARKFKKVSPSKKYSVPVQADEEPVQKGKRVKRSAKKSSTTPAAGIVIRETLVKTKSTGKEKVDVPRGKGIELLSEVALAEKALLKEVRKKSLRDFHRTHLSSSGSVVEKLLSVEKIKHSVTSEGTGLKPGVPDVTKDDSTKSESESWGNDEDDSNDESDAASKHNDKENESDEDETQSENEEGLDSKNDTKENESDLEKEEDVKDDDDEEEEFIHTPSQSDDENDDEIEGDKDKRMVFVKEAGLNEPVHADEKVQEGFDAEMTEAQQWNENVEITQEQVIKYAHVTISTVTKKTEVHATSSSRSSDLAFKFLHFSYIPHTDAEIVSPFDVPV
ncbi:hypothetical protein Tco_1202424 [Tanacetum coccineum]